MRAACSFTASGGGGRASRLLLDGFGGRGGVVLRDEIADLRVDDFTPAAAAEDAVVAGAFHLEVLLLRLRDAGAKAVRGFGLARAGDVVQLAFDGEVRGRLDVLRAHT